MVSNLASNNIFKWFKFLDNVCNGIWWSVTVTDSIYQYIDKIRTRCFVIVNSSHLEKTAIFLNKSQQQIDNKLQQQTDKQRI